MEDNVYSKYTDTDLIAMLYSGDHTAFREIYQRYFPVLHIHAYKRISDEEVIKDILQDIFASLWSKREDIDLKHTLSGYLYAAVSYKITNYYLKQKTENRYLDSLQHYLDTPDSVRTDFYVRHKELHQIIESEINALPLAMRRIFIMSRVDLMPHKEIASVLKLSEHTVRTQIKKALRILRQRLPLFTYMILCSEIGYSLKSWSHQDTNTNQSDKYKSTAQQDSIR
ncbi:RNA polymerase sigma factor [Sphingobacterium yanglingense]|uniref:RNA polymerase sigma-70 factor (Family 1) n=1 Tax=Sphingobacterium yanglingense TaxID=1437280 RepID=A0A4R6WPU3_9SPHI|nr:RNA polymerase sigma-70 factor [Sphingobacterium yanglingense]TDQ80181.1 RNA polymerase sigma-70 factor (family 1) [Sphingobacterium yanglingense]